MTEAKAAELQNGDHVRLIGSETSTGIVEQRTTNSFAIRWNSGALCHYFNNAVPHLETIDPHNP